MKEKVVNLIKDSNFYIPKLLLFNYKKLNISELELIVLIYLINEKDLTFNPKKVSSDLDIQLEETLNIFESIINKDLIKIDNNTFSLIVNTDVKNVNVKAIINDIFLSNSHVYKSRVKIYFKDDIIERTIVGKTSDYLLTLSGEKILIRDIINIEKL